MSLQNTIRVVCLSCSASLFTLMLSEGEGEVVPAFLRTVVVVSLWLCSSQPGHSRVNSKPSLETRNTFENVLPIHLVILLLSSNLIKLVSLSTWFSRISTIERIKYPGFWFFLIFLFYLGFSKTYKHFLMNLL